MASPLFILTFLAALGAGVVGGVFFAFSSFVMKSLARLPAAQGMTAMQSINVVVINVSFMGALFGTAALCAGLLVWAGMNWQRAGSGWMSAGCLLYLIGTIGTTIVFHVPRNDALAAVDPNHVQAARIWADYVTSWTLGNHVRTLASVGACACFILALRES